MGRIRQLKPEFFTSLDVAALSVEAMVTFIGLWPYCDDYGRGPDDTRLIKAAVWPLRDEITPEVVDNHLAELVGRGMIERYVGEDGRRYLAIVNWEKHQRPRMRGKAKYPPPPVPTLFDDKAAQTLSSNGNNNGAKPVQTLRTSFAEPEQPWPLVQGLRVRGQDYPNPTAEAVGSPHEHDPDNPHANCRRCGTNPRSQHADEPTPEPPPRVGDLPRYPKSRVRAVACPKCHATAGQPCRAAGQYERDANHLERVEAYDTFLRSNGAGAPRRLGAEALGRNRALLLDEDEIRDELTQQYGDSELVAAGVAAWREANGSDQARGGAA